MKIPPVDFISKCDEKLHAAICNKEDELDELYYKIHEAVEEELESMRHKRSMMKIYLKIYIMNDNY